MDIVFALASMGITKVSSLQKQILPQLLDGKCDLAIISRTGAGKTLTAAVAAVQAVDTTKQTAQVLFICVSLESALQTHALLCRIAEPKRIKVGLIVKNNHGKCNCV